MAASNTLEKANLIRKWSLISTSEAGSGHPSSCLSAADIAAILFEKFFTYDIKNPKNPNNDHFILSKGHAAPLLYTLFAMSGAYPLKDLKTLRVFGSPLEGHPASHYPYAEAATGSLGQGLSVGAGIAYLHKKEASTPPKTYVLLGDGEMAEGSVWEAANFASYYALNNLIAIVDVNRLAQSQETMFGHSADEYQRRFAAFGWETKVIDGHNLDEIDDALSQAIHNKSDKPFAIVAKTIKGKGISFMEDKDGWHGKAVPKDQLDDALEELGDVDDSLQFTLKAPAKAKNNSHTIDVAVLPIAYKPGDQVATREIYGKVLGEIANDNPLIYALDGDTKNSTFSQDFKKTHPERFIECFIAEQNMVGIALGLSSQGRIPFVSTFASFLTRAYDQIRMSVVSKANIKFVGSHAGVSIGEDGPSQMGLEDIAMFSAFPDSIVLHPCEAVSTAKLLPHLVTHRGIGYMRTLRPKTAVLYDEAEEFEIGGSKILQESKNDVCIVVVAGITVHEALAAHEELEKKGINVGVIDAYSVKPIDSNTIIRKAKQTKSKTIITVEDHFYHGGLGDMVLNAVAGQNIDVIKLAVTEISRSGKQAELLDAAGISSKQIIKVVKSLV